LPLLHVGRAARAAGGGAQELHRPQGANARATRRAPHHRGREGQGVITASPTPLTEGRGAAPALVFAPPGDFPLGSWLGSLAREIGCGKFRPREFAVGNSPWEIRPGNNSG